MKPRVPGSPEVTQVQSTHCSVRDWSSVSAPVPGGLTPSAPSAPASQAFLLHRVMGGQHVLGDGESLFFKSMAPAVSPVAAEGHTAESGWTVQTGLGEV